MAASFMPSFDAGEALERLCSADPPLFLSPSSELSASARAASRHLFSSLLPYCSKPPFDSLLTDDNFDAEQIWSQIDLFSRPIISLIRREVKRLERVAPPVGVVEVKGRGGEEEAAEKKEDGGDGEDEEVEEGEEEEENDDDDVDDDDDGEDDEEEEDEKCDEKRNGVEDRFLKINELEDYLKDDEAKEYGFQKKGGMGKRKVVEDDSDENEGDDEDDEEGDGDDAEFEDLDGGDEDAEDARYEDFFGGKRETAKNSKGCIKEKEGPDGSNESFSDKDEKDINMKSGETLSTHEKELLKLSSKIQEMEKANMDPKMWTMQGEVTAAKRPKNSALEVDLDFEHNVRPPPVITEEVTASIEDLIKKRINEGHFDDVQRAPDLPSKAPKEFKEMDETKSKKGLAEIYEEEYAQKAGLAPAPLSSSDNKKEEASILFKRLCLKLDALAHFHFAPKPVIEEMSIKANVPALAMEEIAPVAVSDAAMLAPEEVFHGRDDVKEEAELTQSDRRRRRANKKRRFKGRSNLSRSSDASAKEEALSHSSKGPISASKQ